MKMCSFKFHSPFHSPFHHSSPFSSPALAYNTSNIIYLTKAKVLPPTLFNHLACFSFGTVLFKKIDFCSDHVLLNNFCAVSLPRKGSMHKKLGTLSSAFMNLPQPISTCACGPFTIYWPPQGSLDLHLSLVQHA